MRTYLFHHGVTCLVVKVLSVSDGQATCEIVRRVHEPKRVRSSEYFRWIHTQPGPREEIILPFDMLRRCPWNVKIRRPQRAPEPLNWGGLILAACIVIAVLISVRGTEPVQDETTERLLAQELADCDEMISRAAFAKKKLGQDWKKWSRYYYETGRSDDQLVDDCNFCGGPQLQTGTDTDTNFDQLDRIEEEQN